MSKHPFVKAIVLSSRRHRFTWRTSPGRSKILCDMICGNFIRSDYNSFLIYSWQQDKADRSKQDKAKKLAEPQQPAEGLTIGEGRDIVERYRLADQQGIGADTTRRNNHANAAHGENAEGIDDAEVPGGAYGEEAEPGAQQIKAPDPDGIKEEQGFVANRPDAGQTMQDIDNDCFNSVINLRPPADHPSPPDNHKAGDEHEDR